MRAIVIIIVSAVALGPAPARADDREEARREFALGQAADQKRDWQTAIEHYLRANDLVPHPFALYNIASDYERLGKLREAATWFERYREVTSDPADREKVNRMIVELRSRPAQLSVRSVPDSARVLIDGQPAGDTPHASQLKGGAHRIVVEKDGMKEVRDVTSEFGEPIELQISLRSAVGILHVRGEPSNALVTLDNMAAGPLPARLQLPPGEHTVKVTSHGYTPYETTVTIVANQEATVDARLVPLATSASTPGTRDEDPGRMQRLAGLTALGVGAAAVVLGGYFGLQARSATQKLDAFYQAGGTWDDERAALERSVTANNARAIGFAVAGGLVMTAGGVLYYLGVGSRSDKVTVLPSEHGAAVVWAGSF